MRMIVGAIAIGSAAVGLLLTVGIFIRRALIQRRERREIVIRGGLRASSLMIAAGGEVRIPPLTPEQEPILSEMLGELSTFVRGDGRARIGAIAEELGLVDKQLQILLRERRAWKRARAARVLGDLASPRAEQALVDALGDRNRDVRATAARSLGHLGAIDGAGPIVRALASGTLPRAVVVESLLLLGGAAVPNLHAASHVGDARARGTSIELIGHLGQASDVSKVLTFMHDEIPDVRAATARTLGRLGSRQSLQPLMDALDDPVDFVRGAAAEALGRMQARPAREDLLAVAQNDTSWWTSAWAARSLAKIDPDFLREAAAAPGASPHLVEAADIASL